MISTAEAAARVGVSKNTLLRWIAEGRLADVRRDWRNWRVWSEADIERARALRDQLHVESDALAALPGEPGTPSRKVVDWVDYSGDLDRLGEGREFRREEVRPRGAKAALVVPVYADELGSLGDARRFRSGEEQRHVG